MDAKLSNNFWLREFLRSEEASRRGRAGELLDPPEAIAHSLARLCQEVLEPLRSGLGGRRAVAIISGWRPPWLNKAVGGSKTSDHLYGRAADLIVAKTGNEEVVAAVRKLRLPVKQCILEFPPTGWVHLSVPEDGVKPRREFLMAVKRDGKTVYSKI